MANPFGGFRAIESPQTELIANPVVTNILLGTPHPKALPGLKILPRMATDWKFQWTEWDKAHLRRRNTERPMGAPYRHDDFHPTRHDSSLKRFSWSSRRDVDEFGIADDSLQLDTLHYVYARMIVEGHLERIRRDAILTASYPADQIITLAAGAEFDSATGGAKAPIVELARLICRRTGWSRRDLKLFLPFDSMEAALADPIFQEQRIGTAAASTDPTAEELARYYGLGEVWTENVLDADDDDTVDQVWGDVAIMYGPGPRADMDTSFGMPVFGRSFGWKKSGVANVPVEIRYPETMTAYPYTDYQRPLILTPGAGGKIINCSKEV